MQTRLARLAAKAAEWIRARLGLVDLVDELPPELPPAPPPESPRVPFLTVPASAFGRLTTSDIWTGPVEAKFVWLTLLTLAGADGTGTESVRQIAALAGLEYPDARFAFEHLIKIRRVETLVDGGWQILNYSRYHEARPVPAAAS